MKLKNFFFVLILTLTNNAHADLRADLKNASPKDVQLLLNLINLSIERSQGSLTTQKAALSHLANSWKLMQNCAQTRMNPSRALPYPHTTSISSTHFNTAAQQQFVTQGYYAQITELVIKQEAIKNKNIANFIQEIRAQARQQAAQAVWHSLAEFYLSMQQTQQDLIASAQSLHPTKSVLLQEELTLKELTGAVSDKNLITDSINYLVDGISLQSFSIFDKQFNKKTDQLMQTLLKSQVLYNDVWQRIETTRVNFYTTHYKNVYALAGELNLPASTFTCIFTGNELPQPS